jgi:protein-S-isoprenylcysteine O-methyltransferase Ste14
LTSVRRITSPPEFLTCERESIALPRCQAVTIATYSRSRLLLAEGQIPVQPEIVSPISIILLISFAKLDWLVHSEYMGATARRVGGSVQTTDPRFTREGLKHAAGNTALAISFFVAMLPAAKKINWSIDGAANLIWLGGAAIMAAMSFVRTPPRRAMVDVYSLSATGGMLLLPCLMIPANHSSGALALAGVTLELLGILLTQVARIYMGRSFGILPANRGVVSRGPFSAVRHPIYIGWLVLSIGYALSYPSARNVVLIVGTLPFMVWRIEQEEALLRDDPEYRSYIRLVRFRLWPGVV